MNHRIVYQNPDGTISIIIPAECGLTIEQIAKKDVPPGVPFRIVDKSELPADRTFRNAWATDGERVNVDMPRAREIHRQTIREIRKPLLEALDVDFMRSVEAGDVAAQKEITTKKQALRDVTADPAIEATRTPEELKAVIPRALSDSTPLRAVRP